MSPSTEKIAAVSKITPGGYVTNPSRVHPTTLGHSLRIHQDCLRPLRVLSKHEWYYSDLYAHENRICFNHPFKDRFYTSKDIEHIMDRRAVEVVDMHFVTSKTGFTFTIPCIYRDEVASLTDVMDINTANGIYHNIIAPELNLHSNWRASYSRLWVLFNAGEVLFQRERSKLAGFAIKGIKHQSKDGKKENSNPHPTDKWVLSLWNLAYDDGKLRRKSHTVEIYRFYGNYFIPDLPVFPVRFSDSKEELEAELIQRGKRYHRMVCDGQSYMIYNGLVPVDKPYCESYRPHLFLGVITHLLDSSIKVKLL